MKAVLKRIVREIVFAVFVLSGIDLFDFIDDVQS